MAEWTATICGLRNTYLGEGLDCSSAGSAYGAYVYYGGWTNLFFQWVAPTMTVSGVKIPMCSDFKPLAADIYIGGAASAQSWAGGTLVKAGAPYNGESVFTVLFGTAVVLENGKNYILRIQNVSGGTAGSVATKITVSNATSPYYSTYYYKGSGSTYGAGSRYLLESFLTGTIKRPGDWVYTHATITNTGNVSILVDITVQHYEMATGIARPERTQATSITIPTGTAYTFNDLGLPTDASWMFGTYGTTIRAYYAGTSTLVLGGEATQTGTFTLEAVYQVSITDLYVT